MPEKGANANTLATKIIVALFIALTMAVVGYAFASLEKMDSRLHELEKRESKVTAALSVLEARNAERMLRIEERIANLHREVSDRCSRIEALLKE